MTKDGDKYQSDERKKCYKYEHFKQIYFNRSNKWNANAKFANNLKLQRVMQIEKKRNTETEVDSDWLKRQELMNWWNRYIAWHGRGGQEPMSKI